jgi:hypothetical protein
MARTGWLCLFIVLFCRLSSKVSFIYNIPLKRNSGRSAGIQRKFVLSAEGGSSQKFFVGGPQLNNSVFCNVELNGANLQAVGFDMDFTLAQVRSNFFSQFPLLKDTFSIKKSSTPSTLNTPRSIYTRNSVIHKKF